MKTYEDGVREATEAVVLELEKFKRRGREYEFDVADIRGAAEELLVRNQNQGNA